MKLPRDIRPEVLTLLTAFFILIWVIAATEAHSHQYDKSISVNSVSPAYMFWSVFVRGPAIIGAVVAGIGTVLAWKKSQ